MPGKAPDPLRFAALHARFTGQRGITFARGMLPIVLLSKLLWWAAVLGGSSLVLGVYAPNELLKLLRTWALSPQRLEALWATLLAVVLWLAFPWIIRTGVDQKLRRLTPDALARRRASRRRARRLTRWILLGLGLLFTAGVMLILRTSERPWLLLAVFLLTQAPLLAGLLAAMGLFVVSGRRLRCARCGYEMGSWAAAPSRCPECGRDWKAPWGARAGTVVRSGRLLAAALAVFALSLAAAIMLARAAMP